MNLQVLPTGAFSANCYVIWNEPDKAVVIDPGADPDKITSILNKSKLTPCVYLLTHGHYDHIAATGEMLKACPAPVKLHENDAAWAFSRVNSFPPYYKPLEKPEQLESNIKDGGILESGTLKIKIIETPGHSPGSVCFYVDGCGMLFSGDTLFAASVGRTDLPGGDWDTLMSSLNKLMNIGDDVKVYAGHGGATTIAKERRTNPYIVNMANK